MQEQMGNVTRKLKILKGKKKKKNLKEIKKIKKKKTKTENLPPFSRNEEYN